MENRIAMKCFSTCFFGNTALGGVLLLGAAVALPAAGHADDWLDTIQDQRCAPEDIEGVSDNARNAIEASVRRAEMSILAPTPVGDLGCLNDLMTAPLDLFSGIGGLLGNLQTGLGSFDMSDLNIDIDVSGMICAFAAEKFATLTEPLSGMDKTISGYAALAADPGQRVSGVTNAAFQQTERGSWNDTFSSGGGGPGATRIGNGVSVSGNVRNTDSSGYSGNVTDFVPANMSPTDTDVVEPIYVDDPGEEVFNDAAWANYNQQLMRSFSEYVGCRMARSLDGTRVMNSLGGGVATWNTPGAVCNFGFVAYPTSTSITSVEPQSASVAPAAPVATHSAAPIDRASGQSRPEADVAAPAERKGSTATIWDQLVK
ncbi:hypothetical protein [Paracoccus sp. ME4]|uniref:hypothetical protein n=1 Tax=Paracoccus sp. ME4 TaxID=3138066 RepID=UPI00398B9F88